jgi:DNA repair protein RadC
MSLGQLMDYNGIGEAKAITILAACELGRRRESSAMPERKIFKTALDIYKYLSPRMRDLDVEESFVILMNQAYKELKTMRLSHGGITETAVDVRLIMKEALLSNATVVALAHNHPSGNTSPSKDDDMLTRKIAEACRTMRLYFLDHVIITDGDYYSYREQGKI